MKKTIRQKVEDAFNAARQSYCDPVVKDPSFKTFDDYWNSLGIAYTEGDASLSEQAGMKWGYEIVSVNDELPPETNYYAVLKVGFQCPDMAEYNAETKQFSKKYPAQVITHWLRKSPMQSKEEWTRAKLLDLIEFTRNAGAGYGITNILEQFMNGEQLTGGQSAEEVDVEKLAEEALPLGKEWEYMGNESKLIYRRHWANGYKAALQNQEGFSFKDLLNVVSFIQKEICEDERGIWKYITGKVPTNTEIVNDSLKSKA